MNLGQLKKLIEDSKLPDSATVIARDRDCCSLDMVHVIGSKLPAKTSSKKSPYGDVVYIVDKPSDMYGGERLEEDGITQAIVFCDCD